MHAQLDSGLASRVGLLLSVLRTVMPSAADWNECPSYPSTPRPHRTELRAAGARGSGDRFDLESCQEFSFNRRHSALSSTKTGLSLYQRYPAKRLDCRYISAIQQKDWTVAISVLSSTKAG